MRVYDIATDQTVYIQQHESYESCAFVYSVMHEINDAENNMSNV